MLEGIQGLFNGLPAPIDLDYLRHRVMVPELSRAERIPLWEDMSKEDWRLTIKSARNVPRHEPETRFSGLREAPTPTIPLLEIRHGRLCRLGPRGRIPGTGEKS